MGIYETLLTYARNKRVCSVDLDYAEQKASQAKKWLNSADYGAFFVCLFDFCSPGGRFMAILIFIAVVDNECPLFT